MQTDPIELVLLTERPAVRDDEPSEIDVVVEIRCRATEAAVATSTAMNLCLVIDRSGSMQGGGKLETAKRSCIEISKRLNLDDLLTVVVFDDEADVVINPQTPAAEVEGLLARIAAGGRTNLSLGWYQGLLELQTYMTDQHHSRLLLLSDGAANAGETKRAVLSGVASKARDAGVTTSTIGIGDDFAEDLLDAIASASGGRFWYIAESKLEEILDQEFKGALSVVLDRPRVQLALPPGTRISRELNKLGKVSGRYRVRPLQGQDTFNFAVRLEIDPAQADATSLRLGASLFDGDQLVVMAGQEIALASLSDVVASDQHPLVGAVVQQFEMESTDEKALDDIASGDIAEIKEMLTAEVAKMRDLHSQMERMRQASDADQAERFFVEMSHLAPDLWMKQASLTISELIEPYRDKPEVGEFLAVWRKSWRHSSRRMADRHYRVTGGDEGMLLGLLVRAIALTETLAVLDPARAKELARTRESLRGYLENAQ